MISFSLSVVGHESPIVRPDLLQQVMLTLIPREKCSTLYNPYSQFLKFTDNMVCVGKGVDKLEPVRYEGF